MKFKYLRASWATPPQRGLSCVTICTNPNCVVAVDIRGIDAIVIGFRRRGLLLVISKIECSVAWFLGTSLIRDHHLLHHPHL